MIRRRDLVRALGGHGLADWTLIERDQQVAVVDDHLRRSEHWLRWLVTVHVDTPAGRGSARVEIDAASGDAEAAVRQAVTLARAATGNAWVTRPAAAPARVVLADAALSRDHVLDAATSLVQRLDRPAGATVLPTVTALHEHVAVVTHQGLRTEWDATRLRAELLIGAGDVMISVTREARRIADLALGAAIRDARSDLALLAAAVAPTGGPCTLVLRPDAMLHGGLGVWACFVEQADAVIERQGLTRYRERAPIAPGADSASEPLSIASNGALDYGLASAPVGDEGDAVRRIPLVERGIAAGLGLSPREGAMRGRDPNGGVRNLEIARGTWPGTLDASVDRVVEVRRLRSLSFDEYTGDASLEIALAIEHAGGAQRPFTGGSLRLDMIAALAHARRSSTPLVRGAYVGPDAIALSGVELFA